MKPKIYSFDIDGEKIFIETSNIEVENSNAKGMMTVSKKSSSNNDQERKFERLLLTLHHISKGVIKTVQAVKPEEFELEMGLSLTGELGIPFITKTASEGTFKVTVKWKNRADKNEECK